MNRLSRGESAGFGLSFPPLAAVAAKGRVLDERSNPMSGLGGVSWPGEDHMEGDSEGCLTLPDSCWQSGGWGVGGGGVEQVRLDAEVQLRVQRDL